jgi:protocatechuate 3,4-dioxygenase beta subunit
MASYSISELGRREILLMSAVVTSFGLSNWTMSARAETKLPHTPEQILGPFYPLSGMLQTTDLTRVSGRSGRAEGQVLNVMGKVLNMAGEPVRNARIEVWQANARGRYTHPSDTNSAPLDPNFKGSAVLVSDAEGRYRFTTIKPAPYPTGPTSMRPAHIHFQVTGKQDRLVTQMYFEGDPYNVTDKFLNTAGKKDILIRKILDATPDLEAASKMVMFDIVLNNG